MSTTHQKIISTLIEQDLDTTEKLKNILEQEGEALKQRNHQQVSELIEPKSQYLNALEISSQKRCKILEISKLPPTNKGWGKLLDTLGSEALIEQWQTLQQAFADCQRLNEVNGKIIGRSRHIFNRLLTIFRGQVETPTLYNQTGNTQNHGGNRTLIKA